MFNSARGGLPLTAWVSSSASHCLAIPSMSASLYPWISCRRDRLWVNSISFQKKTSLFPRMLAVLRASVTCGLLLSVFLHLLGGGYWLHICRCRIAQNVRKDPVDRPSTLAPGVHTMVLRGALAEGRQFFLASSQCVSPRKELFITLSFVCCLSALNFIDFWVWTYFLLCACFKFCKS